jgi:putative Mg2+ transporter-C (MgtC) family protein
MTEFELLGPLSLRSCLFAILCGLIIGFERQWNGKPAGIRTSILICLSASIFVSLGHYYQPDTGTVRIVGQIVTGVGFLGAGVIIAREGLLQGVTSAALIWILAAIGCLIGLEYNITAVIISVLTVFVLVGITYLERAITKLKRGVHKEKQPE